MNVVLQIHLLNYDKEFPLIVYDVIDDDDHDSDDESIDNMRNDIQKRKNIILPHH